MIEIIRRLVASGAADWLSLAAAPTFALMAVVTGIADGGPHQMSCSAAMPVPLTGMVPMYALMSAFHLTPWLRLILSASPLFRAWRTPLRQQRRRFAVNAWVSETVSGSKSLHPPTA